MIEDGAYFKGSIEIDKSAEKETGSAFSKSSNAGSTGHDRTQEHIGLLDSQGGGAERFSAPLRFLLYHRQLLTRSLYSTA